MRKTLAFLLLTPALLWAAAPKGFGPNLQLAGAPNQTVELHADLDGDGTKDDVYLIQVTGPVQAGLKQIALGQGAKLAPGLALAVELHPGGQPVRYILHDHNFFDTPTWKAGKYRGMVKLGHGPQPPKDAKGPSIGLFTESGALYYVRWDGKTFVGTSEGDEP